MESLFTREQIRHLLKTHNLKDGKSIADFLRQSFAPFIQEALEAEMDEQLGYTRYNYQEKAQKQGKNSRNGHHKKRLRTDFGELEIAVPQDTNGEFEPQIVPKYKRDINPSIQDAILSMYAKGMSTHDIDSHIGKIYGVSISAEMVSRITDKILPIAKAWQERPLEDIYPIVYLDGMVFNVVDSGVMTKKTAYVVYGVTIEGFKEILGIWVGECESSKFWMGVLNDLKQRGVKDILIISVDGLKGFTQAIKAVYPDTQIQRCMVHHIRNCTKYVTHRDRKEFCADMKPIYKANNEKQALESFEAFKHKWNETYPYAIRSWESNWDELMEFMKYPAEIRRLIYTTNPIEAFNRGVRKVTKSKTSFRSIDSLFKLLYLASQDIQEKWTMPIPNWGLIFNQLVIYFGERVG